MEKLVLTRNRVAMRRGVAMRRRSLLERWIRRMEAHEGRRDFGARPGKLHIGRWAEETSYFFRGHFGGGQCPSRVHQRPGKSAQGSRKAPIGPSLGRESAEEDSKSKRGGGGASVTIRGRLPGCLTPEPRRPSRLARYRSLRTLDRKYLLPMKSRAIHPSGLAKVGGC